MQVLASNTIPAESWQIAAMVKKQILFADPSASVILFGSRARGDAADDSDWDFLVLTKRTDTVLLGDELKKRILKEVELKYNVAISLIVKNTTLWESDYSVTNIYESISEEGVML